MAMKTQPYYWHGTTGPLAVQIEKDGLLKPAARKSWDKGRLTSLEGSVYFSKLPKEALRYALDRAKMGRAKTIGIVRVKAPNPADILPDEDTLGHILGNYYTGMEVSAGYLGVHSAEDALIQAFFENATTGKYGAQAADWANEPWEEQWDPDDADDEKAITEWGIEFAGWIIENIWNKLPKALRDHLDKEADSWRSKKPLQVDRVWIVDRAVARKAASQAYEDWDIDSIIKEAAGASVKTHVCLVRPISALLEGWCQNFRISNVDTGSCLREDNDMPDDKQQKAHPFEMSGCGVGPFRLVGVWSAPSSTMAEEYPDSYREMMRGAPEGAGSCNHCGMPIRNNYIIRDSSGKKFVVGSECVLKTDDESLKNAVKVAAARLRREQARQRKHDKERAKRAAWEASPEGKAEIAYRAKAAAAREEREKARTHKVVGRFGFVLDALDGASGDFAASIARQIRAGEAPGGRALRIVGEIYAKTFGRGGSKAYNAAMDDFYDRVGDDEEE